MRRTSRGGGDAVSELRLTPPNPLGVSENGEKCARGGQTLAEVGRSGQRKRREEKNVRQGREEPTGEERAQAIVREVWESKRGSLWEVARRIPKGDDPAPYATAFDQMSVGREVDDGDTLERLTEMMSTVRFPPQGEAYLRSALEEADRIKLPGLSTPMQRRVAAWGLVLHRRLYPSPFWLSQRSVAWGMSVPGLLGCSGPELEVSRRRGERLLKLLVDRHVFEIVVPGKPGYGRATRYCYIGPEPGGQPA